MTDRRFIARGFTVIDTRRPGLISALGRQIITCESNSLARRVAKTLNHSEQYRALLKRRKKQKKS